MNLASITHHLYGIFISMGGFGLLLLGVLDSSFLFMPLGNDLLVLALCARKHVLLPYYAAMAAAGSILGCLLLDLVVRKGGESELEKHLSPRRIEYVKGKIKARAGFALALASVMPPPFPFTPFVIGASAFQYPRKRMLAVVGATRLLRFAAEGALAIFFGQQILDLAKTGWVKDVILALVVLAVAGSILSVLRWLRSRRPA